MKKSRGEDKVERGEIRKEGECKGNREEER